MSPGKVAANRGVPRNKKPLQNKVYRFEERVIEGKVTYFLLWGYERDINQGQSWNFHGSVTSEEIRERLSDKQWSKFRQGTRDFIIQRRVDKHNVPIT